MSKFHWKEWVLACLTMTMVTACNGNSPFSRQADPLSSHGDLKDDVTVAEVPEEQREQQALIRPFVVDVTGDDVTRLNFIVGQASSHEISARIFDEAQFTLQLKGDAPEGLQLLEKDSGNGLWEIVWTPPQDLVSPTDDDGVEIPIQIELVITEASEEVRARLAAIEKILDFTLAIGKSVEAPTVVGVPEMNTVETLNENDNYSFSVIVEDPSSTTVTPKILIDTNLGNVSQENPVYYGGNAIIRDSEKPVEDLGNGQWKFHFKFNAAVPAMVHQANKVDNKVTVEFRLQTQSEYTQESSVVYSKQITIEYNSEVDPADVQADVP
ncbi:MAG: hypothetical protein HRT44_04245 [Bdellovibrionales bacterium]|nr:hypothetical protein [Bdellovibrionales bacterium]NQZ18454.1 hypothetical protein [Bdellovibrionales bacterium]